jgi:hypothetical protein
LLAALLIAGCLISLGLQATRTIPFIPWPRKYFPAFLGLLFVGVSLSVEMARPWGFSFLAIGLLTVVFVFCVSLGQLIDAAYVVAHNRRHS